MTRITETKHFRHHRVIKAEVRLRETKIVRFNSPTLPHLLVAGACFEFSDVLIVSHVIRIEFEHILSVRC